MIAAIPLRPCPLLLATLLLTASPAAAASAPGRPKDGATRGVANARLALEARRAPLKAIDYGEDRCDRRTVKAWLTALTGPEARAIAWVGGPCELVGPGIDAGGQLCAQARITLAHPQSHDDKPVIEIFFEGPVGGEPGPPYAFRAHIQAADGQEMIRFRKDFESAWTSRFPAPPGAIVECPAP